MPARPPAKAELHACPKLRAALRGSEAAVEQRLQRGGADSTAIAAELSELRMRCASLEAERAQRDVAMARLESRLGSKEDEVQQLREELHSIRSSPGGADGPEEGDSAC